MREDLPTGTVTLLFTDVAGSTKLLHELGDGGYAEALATHRRVIREACARHHGVEVDTQGDAFFFAFEDAPAAFTAAAELTEALSSGPVQVRVGLHTGTPLVSDEGYVGVDVHRAARIAASGHGGQVLVSESTASLVDGDLRDLGEHRFKDLLAAERVYQLGSHEFPPLRSLGRTNLPIAAWPLVGRERELAEIRSLVVDGGRLVTLTGPGGSGKTRLALQAAAELSEEFRDGTFFVALAPLRDSQAVHSTVAEAVGLQPDDDLVGWLASRRVLLVLDNLEHLEGIAAIVSELLVGEVVVLATSRASLHLSAERELPVEPLPDEAAAELFVSRAAAAGRHLAADETVAAVCRRLDNLPLAIELAAARAKLLPPAALLQRLDEALPLLAGGAIDLPERQRTLRATIEWSHDLLDPDAQAAFRRLSVFRGSFTLDAAEAITGADLDQLAALLDQSLLKTLGDERFFLLETLREYARERLDEAGETAEYALRHARWYLDRLQANYPDRLGARQAEILAWYDAEEDNLRAMLDRLSDAAPIEAARAAYMLHFFWRARGAVAEEHERLRALLARDDLRSAVAGGAAGPSFRRRHARGAGGRVGGRRSRGAGARRARYGAPLPRSRRAGVLFDSSGRHRGGGSARPTSRSRKQRCSTTRRVFRRWATSPASSQASSAPRRRGRSSSGSFTRLAGAGWWPWRPSASPTSAGYKLVEHDYESSRAAYAAVLTQLRSSASKYYEMESLKGLGLASLGLGQRVEARAAFAEMLELALAATRTHSVYVAEALSGMALAAEPADADRAARLRGAVAQLNSDAGVVMNAYFEADEELERRFERELVAVLGEEAWEREKTAGSTMTLEQAIAVARFLCDGPASAV